MTRRDCKNGARMDGHPTRPRARDVIPRPLRPLYYEVARFRQRWRRFPGMLRVPARGHAVLTFDDGPDPDATPAVLDALDDAQVKATFFLVGEQMEAHPDLAPEIADRGHELALHAFHHRRHDQISADAARDDIERGAEALAALPGGASHWFRPPFGRFTADSYAAAGKLGLTPVYWSSWGIDWEPIAGDRISRYACRHMTDGTIVLLHDSARYSPRTTAAPTAAAIMAIAGCARRRGLDLVTLGEAAGDRRPAA